jgi:alpha-ketoglutarate-dependent taurine dioxygenase
MTFENMPSDYAVLKMSETPPSGGDTLWASAYEVYDRLSTPMQKFLESLTATHDNPSFIDQAARLNFHIHPGPRGAPENTGTDLIASHPVIRTNPVTGWKSVYSCHGQTQRINELTAEESEDILKYLNRLTYGNHDLQVRFRWGVGDVAIWDNRCTFHTATKDLDGSGPRTGNRSASMGERPFMDPSSSSRREALAMRGS